MNHKTTTNTIVKIYFSDNVISLKQSTRERNFHNNQIKNILRNEDKKLIEYQTSHISGHENPIFVFDSNHRGSSHVRVPRVKP